jgi:cell division protein ZapA
MPTVEILVNGRRHEVSCGEGEETRVRQLASYVDRRIADLAKGQSQIGDARLLLMASLVVADELSDAFDEIKRLRATLEDQGFGDSERVAASVLEQITQKIDAIAVELERA